MLHFLICLSIIAADDPQLPADAVRLLEANGFRVTARRLTHAGETAASKGLREAGKIKKEIRGLRRDLTGQEQLIEQNRIREAQARELDSQLNVRLANARDVATNNQIVAQLNYLTNERQKLYESRQQLEKDRDALRGLVAKATDDYIQTVQRAKSHAENALTAYASLKENTETKNAVLAIWKATDKKFKATPPAKLENDRKKLTDLSAAIRQQSVRGELRANTLSIAVSIGEAANPVEMVVDSGASVVCLPDAVAKSVGIQVADNAPLVLLQIADGSVITARRIVLPVVRVGPFEAANVEAAVLGPEANQASCLLGMSFLSRFDFKLDLSNKSLLLREVSDD